MTDAAAMPPAKPPEWKWTQDGRLLVEMEGREPVAFRSTEVDADDVLALQSEFGRLQEVALIIGQSVAAYTSGGANYRDCYRQVCFLVDGILDAEAATEIAVGRFCAMMDPDGLFDALGGDMRAAVEIARSGLERMR